MVCAVSFLAASWSSWGPVGVQFSLYIFYPPSVRIGIPIAAIGIPKRHQWTCKFPRVGSFGTKLQKSEPPKTPSPLSHRRLRLRALEHTHRLIPISAPQAVPTRRGLVAPATRCARRLVAPPRPRIPRAAHRVSSRAAVCCGV